LRTGLPAPLRLIVGTGAESTLATIERTRAAAAEGAEAALVIAPSYFRAQLTADALRAHYHAVADASPIPILIYNVPVHMGYDLGVDWMAQLAGHPNMAGLKESSGDIARLPTLHARLGPDFVLLTGAGEKLVDALTAGAAVAGPALYYALPRQRWLPRGGSLVVDVAVVFEIAPNPVMHPNRVDGYDGFPARPPAGHQLGTLLASLFLQAGLVHAGGNMW